MDLEGIASKCEGATRRESDLVARARRGDGDALEPLFRAYEGRVYNLARRICATAEEAEEVLQETFLELARSLGAYRGTGSLWAWIRKIAASKALMRLRRDRIRRTEPLDEDRDETTTPPREGGRRVPAPEQRLDLESALARLSDVSRAVVWLHDVEGYTHEEIAELMQRSVSFSKSQLARAHQRLRAWLGTPPAEERRS